MISVEKRPIVITSDIDGVHTIASIPLATFGKLLIKRCRLDREAFEITPYAYYQHLYQSCLLRNWLTFFFPLVNLSL